MSYVLRKNYFKDYLWNKEGDHGYWDIDGGPPAVVVGTNDLTPYDNKYWWFDVRWTTGGGLWHIAELKSTTKYYALYKHEYPTVGPGYTNKMGLFGLTNNATTPDTNLVESAHEVPPSAVGGATRPGFEGQFGKASGVQFTGTIYEFAFGYTTGVYSTDDTEWDDPTPTPGSPNTQYAPFGFTLYCNGGVAGDHDGIHVIILPPVTELRLYNTSGVATTYAGGANGKILICKGLVLDPYNSAASPPFQVVFEIDQYDNGDNLGITDDEEYFIRIEYWPEARPLKYLNLDNEITPNLDRRLRIWLSTDKKTKFNSTKLVGEYAMIESDYTSAVKYIAAFNFNCFNNLGDPHVRTAYWPTLHQYDEFVVGSEWLPYDEMIVDQMKSDAFSKCDVFYDKSENELTHNAASTTDQTPNFFTTDRAFNQLEVFSRCEVIPTLDELFYLTDFRDAFPDGWSVTNTTGTWGQEDSITEWKDEFYEQYTNKGNDPNWTVAAGTVDTTTRSGEAYYSGGGALRSAASRSLDSDYVYDTTLEASSSTTAGDNIAVHWGQDAGFTSPNGALYMLWRPNNDTYFLYERQGGAWVLLDSYVGLTLRSTSRTIKMVRIGAYAKVYVDDTLILQGKLTFTASPGGYTFTAVYNNQTLYSKYIRIQPPFPNDYAYMSNTASSTAVAGDISRLIATNQDSGYVNVKFWEAMDEAGATAPGRIFVKVYYAADPGYMGFRLKWDDATQEYKLRIYQAGGTSKAITLPEDDAIVNGVYHERALSIHWAISGGNVTQIQIRNDADGQLLGEYTGLALAVAANPTLEIEINTTDGCETVYTGMTMLTETPDPDLVLIETPVFHGQVRHIVPSDDNGMYLIKAVPMDYPLRMIPSFTTGPINFLPESSTTDELLLKNFLLENGDDYWRWFHFWNFEISKLPNTWIPHRIRGQSAWDMFKAVAEYSGLQWMITPEQQFLFTDYYRDLYTVDEIEIGVTPPQGLYMSTSTISDYNKTQTNWITSVTRVDDNTLNKRVGEMNLQPCDFDWGADATDQVWNTVAGAHQAPSMTSFNPVTRTGNLTANEGYAGQDIIEATIGADDPAAANVSNFLNTWGDSILASYSHKNERFIIECLGSKQWLRPMDKIEVKMGVLDPTLENVFTVLYDYLYVVQRAYHICHENKVRYTVGRMEVYDDEGDTVGVDGYGDTRSAGDRFKRTKDNAWEALSQGVQ